MDSVFSRWLIAQMNKKNWSQSRTADESGLSRQAIANYVDGRIPDHESILALARVFKARPEGLFRMAIGLREQPDEDPWVEDMDYKLRQISTPRLREMAERLIDSLMEEETSHKSNQKNHPRPKPISND